MIDDDTVKRLAVQAGFGLIEYVGINDRERAFARAIWSLGRDAGLHEAAEKGRDIVLGRIRKRGSGDFGDAEAVYQAIRALKENKHESR